MKVILVNENIVNNYGAQLLASRGVTNVQQFCNPTTNDLQSWQDLCNIQKGVELITKLEPDAIIALVVDSDVDGFTSSSIIYQYLRQLNDTWDIRYFLHSGKAHGLEEHWEDIDAGQYDLIIVPDAGTNDSWYVDQLGVETLVIDHHLLEDPNISPLMTLINNQESPQYHNKNLSGAGMAYQFCRALDAATGHNLADQFIDLAALGVCADMMSGLEIENQYLWREGFSHIHNYFFQTLARKQAYSITGQMNASDADIIEALDPTSVAFYIVPLINAMIRVGNEGEKDRLFQAFINGHKSVPSGKRGAKGTFEEVAIESTRECVNARTHQNKFLDEAAAQLEQKILKHDLLSNQILFIRLDEEKFPSELNGLIAMRLSQKYKHPTIVARRGPDGMVKGSARGLSNSELTSFKNFLSDTGLFEYTQGHDQAFGISINGELLDALHKCANERLAQYDFNSNYYEVNFKRQAMSKDLGLLIEDLDKYRHIWSQQNQQPLIYVTDLHFTHADIQIMGKNKDTLKIVKNGVAYMKFFAKELIKELNGIDGDIKVEIVGKPNLNCWNGTITPQLFIEQIEVKEDKLLDF